MPDFDSNPFFVLSRPELERQELFESLVQDDAIDTLIKWFGQRGRVLNREQARKLVPQVISAAYRELPQDLPTAD